MTEIDLPEVAAHVGDGPADQTARDGWGEAAQGSNVEDCLPGGERNPAGYGTIDLSVPEFLVLAGEIGVAGQDGRQAMSPFGGERGQQDVSDAVPVKGEIAVGRVLAPGQPFFAQVAFDFSTRDIQERPDKAAGGHGANPGKAGRIGTAQHPEQNGLGLIVPGVRGCDPIEVSGGQQTAEELQAGEARGLLEVIGNGGDGPRFGDAGEAKAGGETLDEVLVSDGLRAPQAVIQMYEPKMKIPFGFQFCQKLGQADRIGSTGDGDADAGAGPEHAITRDGFRHLVEQRHHGATIVSDPMNPHILEHAKKTRLLLMDVDGVLTDGKLYNVPGADGQMVETKGFDSQDGIALQWLSWKGIRTGLISGRVSPATEVRAKQCKFAYVYQGHIEKIPILEEILADARISKDEVAYIGDDLTDIVVMRRVGLAIATENARPEVKAAAGYVTTAAGGKGAVREVAELLLKAQGCWEELLRKYEA